ncbi:MAG: DUF669 domain-containing protein [Lactobacillaceae bacterium]|nr:DUF669 domain-containing protein [Lactobacillaceae bacterium]
MTAFLKTDFDQVSLNEGYDALDTGKYEVIIKKVEERISIAGNKGISFRLQVRKDLANEESLAQTNGKFGGRVFFSNIWDSEKNPDYKYKMLNIIAISAGVSDNKIFNTFEDFKKELEGQPVRINITHDVSMYLNEKRIQEQIAMWDWYPTNYVLEVV